MRYLYISLILIVFTFHSKAQERPINKLTLETTYSYVEIHKSLRDLIDESKKDNYFHDEFFNELLRKIIVDKRFTEAEKVQLFYLMQKKIGYAFVGTNYLPPQQNYFNHHAAKVITWQKTKAVLKDLNYNVTTLIKLVNENRGKDNVLASNALLLASLLNTDTVCKTLEYFTKAEFILQTKNPDIFNHAICMSASLIQNDLITSNLIANIKSFKSECMIEDAFCALYSKNNPVATIRDYILLEKNSLNDLSIQTALCALANRVSPATFQKSIESLCKETKEKWKTELCTKILSKSVPFNYTLANKDQLVTKNWDNVQISLYIDGVLISNGTLLEFDPN